MKPCRTVLFWAAAVLTAVCLALAGCESENRSLLWYQECLSEVTVAEGERVWKLTPTADGFSVEILAPSAAAGVTFRIAETSASVSVGGVQIPAGDAMTAGARRVIALFTLSEERLVGVEADRDGEAVIARYETDAGTVTVTIGDGGIPLSFETEGTKWTVGNCQLQERTDDTNGSK